MGSVWGIRWTEQRTARLRELHAQGLSFGKIADKLGVTREACAGKVSRMGLSTRQVAPRKPRQTTPQKSGPVLAQLRVAPSVQPTLPPMPEPDASTRRCTLLQLTNGVCKWPFGAPQSPDFFFCGGDAVDGKPYCVEHCRVAYRM